MRGEGIVISRNATILSKDGIPHEVDIYYEFEKANIKHRVAIECKNTERPIEKGKVQEFESKIRDLNNVVGVIISKSGYQENAKKFAESHGILALTEMELPSIGKLLAQRLATVALPDETYIGEPFWTIMEIRDGRITGSYYGQQNPNDKQPHIPLFFSKQHAEMFFNVLNNKDGWVIRGLPQYSLRALLIMVIGCGWETKLYWRLPWDKNPNGFAVIPMTIEQLKREYFIGELPQNIPSIKR